MSSFVAALDGDHHLQDANAARARARAPYFHNGIAATLEDVVRHYEKFLGFVFTDQERADLVGFLRAL